MLFGKQPTYLLIVAFIKKKKTLYRKKDKENAD
jgi:hypothetical protein